MPIGRSNTIIALPGYQGSGFRVQGSGFRVQGSGFRVQGARLNTIIAYT